MRVMGSCGWSIPKFCTLCTIDPDHSFNPRWRPPFVTALAPQDRCHLNGLAMVEGRTRYVTMLGETDTVGRWRENKRSGGLLMDITNNEILLRGLSMPHSPRMYKINCGCSNRDRVRWRGWIWKRRLHTVCRLPGLRGISFVGPLAFIGLSQVHRGL